MAVGKSLRLSSAVLEKAAEPALAFDNAIDTEADALQGAFSNAYLEVSAFGNKLFYTREKSAAARENNSLIVYIGGELGWSLLEGAFDSINDLLEIGRYSLTNLGG